MEYVEKTVKANYIYKDGTIVNASDTQRADEKYEKISSSELRSRLSEKENFEELVPSKVFEYIKGLCF